MARRRRRVAKKHVELLKRARPHYDAMLKAQGGKCAIEICPRVPSPKRKLDMDHDHKRLCIRGLLCHRCNRALPAWVTPEWLRAAADYLEKEPWQL